MSLVVDCAITFIDLDKDVIQDGDKLQKYITKCRKEGMNEEVVAKAVLQFNQPLTLGAVCSRSLVAENRENPPKGNGMIRQYKLATLLADSVEVELTLSEIRLLKKVIYNAYKSSPLIVAQAWERLGSKDDE